MIEIEEEGGSEGGRERDSISLCLILFISQTFFEKMFCTEKVRVATRALHRPTTSKDTSVADDSTTPMWRGGKKDKGEDEHTCIHSCTLSFSHSHSLTSNDRDKGEIYSRGKGLLKNDAR